MKNRTITAVLALAFLAAIPGAKAFAETEDPETAGNAVTETVEAKALAEAAPDVSKVLRVVDGHWTGLGNYRAYLTAGDDFFPEPGKPSNSVDLWIYSTSNEPPKLVASQKGIAFKHGNTPELQPFFRMKGESLLVISRQYEKAVIPNGSRWQETLALAYQNGRILVTGYAYKGGDLIDSKANVRISCDMDFLTGHGVRQGKKFTTSIKAVPLEQWEDLGKTGKVIQDCRNIKP
jgi:hypothetical protein